MTLHVFSALNRPKKEKCSPGNAQMPCPVPRTWSSEKEGNPVFGPVSGKEVLFLAVNTHKQAWTFPRVLCPLGEEGGCHSPHLLGPPNLPQNKRFRLKVDPLPLTSIPTHSHPDPQTTLTRPSTCHFRPPSARVPPFASLFEPSSLWVMVVGVFTMDQALCYLSSVQNPVPSSAVSIKASLCSSPQPSYIGGNEGLVN